MATDTKGGDAYHNVGAKIVAWDINEVGWSTFEEECLAITRGRTDLRLMTPAPGVMELYEVPTGTSTEAPRTARAKARA